MGIFSDIKDKITSYIEVNIKLFKIDFIGTTASLLSFFMFALISLFVLCCIILFLGFGLTEVFVDAGMSKFGSFFLTTGIYCLFFVVVVLLRKKIINFFSGAFINVMTEEEEEEKEDKKPS